MSLTFCRAKTRAWALSWCFLCPSGCSAVLADQAVDDLSAFDPRGNVDRLAGLVQRRSLSARLVLWVPKTCVAWADALQIASARSAFERRAGRSWSVRGWDDLRLAGLKLIFLVVTRAVSVLGLSQREAWWKGAEITLGKKYRPVSTS